MERVMSFAPRHGRTLYLMSSALIGGILFLPALAFGQG
jgi:hypothetical protein